MTSRAAWLLVGGSGVVVWVVLASWSPPEVPADTVCLLRSTTGASCPGCGFGRAAAAAARGDVIRSIRLHPMAPVVAFQGVAIWLAWGAVALGRVPRPRDTWIPWFLVANVAAFVAIWAIRSALGILPP